jgi:signal transduction histidine kinase
MWVMKGGGPGKRAKRDVISSMRLLDRETKVNGKFRKVLTCFQRATSHEVGNPLLSLMYSKERYPQELQEAINKFSTSYSRFKIFVSLAGSYLRQPDELKGHLKASEIKALGIRKGRYRLNNSALKQLALKETRMLIRLLADLEKTSENLACDIGDTSKRELALLISGGKPLFTLLERLLKGETDIDYEVAQRIDMISTISLTRDIEDLASTHGCSCVIRYDDALEGTLVRSNVIIRNLIFSNIISNSRKAMKNDEELQVNIFQADDRIIFEFKDKGCGMAADVMEQLNSGVRVTKKQGIGEHGNGFPYCRDLALKMGGSLYVKESEIGKGTTVILEAAVAGQ